MDSISLLIEVGTWEGVTKFFVYLIWTIAGICAAFEISSFVMWMITFAKGRQARLIRKHIKKYEATFLKNFAEGMKTTMHAIEILPMSTLQPGVALSRSIPNVHVGIGILGTFVGLSIGVLGLQNQGSAAEIQQGIQGLLQSMSTAFVTSVWGMATSIILSLLIFRVMFLPYE